VIPDKIQYGFKDLEAFKAFKLKDIPENERIVRKDRVPDEPVN
jgi:hypothetical protein